MSLRRLANRGARQDKKHAFAAYEISDSVYLNLKEKLDTGISSFGLDISENEKVKIANFIIANHLRGHFPDKNEIEIEVLTTSVSSRWAMEVAQAKIDAHFNKRGS